MSLCLYFLLCLCLSETDKAEELSGASSCLCILGTVTAPFKWLVTAARVGTVPCSGQSWGLGLKHRQGEFVLVPLSSAVGQGIPFLQETAGVGDVLKCSPCLQV